MYFKQEEFSALIHCTCNRKDRPNSRQGGWSREQPRDKQKKMWPLLGLLGHNGRELLADLRNQGDLVTVITFERATFRLRYQGSLLLTLQSLVCIFQEASLRTSGQAGAQEVWLQDQPLPCSRIEQGTVEKGSESKEAS